MRSTSIISMDLSFMIDYYDHVKPAITIEAFCKENIQGISLQKLSDIVKCVKEALNNVKEHAYKEHAYNEGYGKVHIFCNYKIDNTLVINVIDYGCGIPNIRQAFKSGWSSKEGFAGMGMSVMDSLCDEIAIVRTSLSGGTNVIMTFNVGPND